HNAGDDGKDMGINLTAGATTVVFSPPSLNFGSLPVGNTSVPQVVVLSNTGTSTLTISNISVPSGYSQVNNCGGSVLQNSSCNITVTFKPSSIASFNGNLQVTDNASGSPQSASLAGSGKSASILKGVVFQGVAIQ